MHRVKSVGVYCSAAKNLEAVYVESAKAAGKLVAEKNWELVYGGGRRGLMGVVANSAMEAGGFVVGYIPNHLVAGEEAHEGINELHVVPDMHVRKMSMYDRSDAFLILPGGFGTLEEFFEVLVWKQIRLHSKPIVIVNINGFWDPLKALMAQVVEQHFARPNVWDMCTFIDDVASIPDGIGSQLAIELPEDKWS